jgi:hypothetical protein
LNAAVDVVGEVDGEPGATNDDGGGPLDDMDKEDDDTCRGELV